MRDATDFNDILSCGFYQLEVFYQVASSVFGLIKFRQVWENQLLCRLIIAGLPKVVKQLASRSPSKRTHFDIDLMTARLQVMRFGCVDKLEKGSRYTFCFTRCCELNR